MRKGSETVDLQERVQEKDSICTEYGDYAQMRKEVLNLLAAFYNTMPGNIEMLSFALAISDVNCDNGDMNIGLKKLEDVARHSQQCKEEELIQFRQALGVEWTRLFRGVKPGYGPPPPKESSFRLLDKHSLVLQYAQSGLHINPQMNEDVDYLGVEVQFLATLIEKEEQCWRLGLVNEALQVIEREYGFLLEHLWSWVPEFCAVALPQATTAFGEGIILLTRGLLQMELEWLSITREEVKGNL